MPFDLKLEAVPNTPDSQFMDGYFQARGIDVVRLMGELKDAPWVDRQASEMRYRGNTLKRQKFFLNKGPPVCDGQPAMLYKYSYPGFQYKSMRHYKSWETLPYLATVLRMVERDLNFNFNHVIGTLYEHDTDEIGAHQDKMTDIAAGTPIVSLSLGDARELHLTDGRDATRPPQHIQVLSAGDLFLLGPRTNATMFHAVAPIAAETTLRQSRRGGVFGPRISLVLRQITTGFTLGEVQRRLERADADKERRGAAKEGRGGQACKRRRDP